MHPLFHDRRYLIPFRGSLLPQIFCDTLIVGTGVAGLRSALAAAEHGEVIVLAKAGLKRSSTSAAQGGIAAAMGRSPEAIRLHVEDTIQTGAGLCDSEIVQRIVSAAEPRINELRQWGMQFDVHADGAIDLVREGGHRESRVLHANGDATGRELVRCLFGKILETPNIRVFENCFALDLLTRDGGGDGPVLGAITHHPRYGLQMIWSWSTILATGGASGVFRETTNPPGNTGDGIAMAWRAGAEIADMALQQFHPTTLYIAGAPRSLISEAVRGEGAHLVDRTGGRFMADVHPMGELAPRDIVSRACIDHLAKTSETHVFLDARHFDKEYFAKRFPGISAQLQLFNIDPERDLIPVHPSAHYTIGGIWCDAQGRTNRPGLYACGETACNGLHGANRLASNSLLEGLVLGEEVGRICSESRAEGGSTQRPRPIISDVPISPHGGLDLSDVRSSLLSVTWRHLGIVRQGPFMDDVRDMIDFWARYTLDKIFDDPQGWEMQNMLFTASLLCNSARWRAESRGTHARLDFPQVSDEFACHDLWQRAMDEPRTVRVHQPTGESTRCAMETESC